jgi:general secretion pathway protein K
VKPSPLKSNNVTDGAALMAVLWLIAVLSLACMTTLRVISFDMEIASAKIHGSRARQFAEMGIAVASNPAVSKRSDPILHSLDATTGEGYEATFASEGGRFNINHILLSRDKPLMQAILVHWGISLDDAQPIVDALVDWVDGDNNEELHGAEQEYYEKIGRINQPFNRPFYNLSEMRLVRGMDLVESVRPDWRNWFTVWSAGKLDLNEASAELIAVAAEMGVEQADSVPEHVRGPDGVRNTDDDARFTSVSEALALLGIDANGRPDIAARFTLNDVTTRLESIGHAEGSKFKITVVVANRAGKPAILERTEETIP